MNLAGSLVNHICFGGRIYRLNLSYDNVLRVFDVWRETLFSPAQRTQLAVELLAGRRAGRLPYRELDVLYKQIFKEYINEGAKSDPSKPRTLDFVQDAPLIYAAFWQAYRIDLTKQKGHLDWRYFIALLQGLPEDTRLRAVMDIRERDIPEPNKYNAEQIAALVKAKAYYAIKFSDEEAEYTLQAGIDKFAASLISQAKRGANDGRTGRQGRI